LFIYKAKALLPFNLPRVNKKISLSSFNKKKASTNVYHSRAYSTTFVKCMENLDLVIHHDRELAWLRRSCKKSAEPYNEFSMAYQIKNSEILQDTYLERCAAITTLIIDNDSDMSDPDVLSNYIEHLDVAGAMLYLLKIANTSENTGVSFDFLFRFSLCNFDPEDLCQAALEGIDTCLPIIHDVPQELADYISNGILSYGARNESSWWIDLIDRAKVGDYMTFLNLTILNPWDGVIPEDFVEKASHVFLSFVTNDAGGLYDHNLVIQAIRAVNQDFGREHVNIAMGHVVLTFLAHASSITGLNVNVIYNILVYGYAKSWPLLVEVYNPRLNFTLVDVANNLNCNPFLVHWMNQDLEEDDGMGRFVYDILEDSDLIEDFGR